MKNFAMLVLWAIIGLLVWVVTAPFRRGRDNCLTWALRQQRQKGGYVVIRWGRSGWWRHPHFGWMPEEFHVGTQHYVPAEDEANEKTIPDFWFDGVVKQGDGNEHIQRIRKGFGGKK